MTDLQRIFEVATDRIEVDFEAACLAEARRRRHRTQGFVAAAAAACLVVAVAAGARFGDESHGDPGPADPPPSDVVPTPTAPSSAPSSPPSPAATGVATQPVWDPFAVADAPLSSVAFAEMLGAAADGLAPDIEPGANPVEADPMTGVVVAWPEKGAGLRLLGTDGRWRSAPASMEGNVSTDYSPDAPAISSDGTLVAAATEGGIRVLDVTTGDVTTIAWPDAIEQPWDWAPGLRWLPDDDALLVLHWNRPLVVGLDGEARPAPYPTEQGVHDVFGISPEGPIYQNDYPRNTLQTWEGDEVVQEVPFPQCERLTAAYGLVACTTGSLESMRSGPVVVDAATGEIVAYAPIEDDNAFYSDNGYLTTLGFLDPDTVVLLVGPRDRASTLDTVTWHLVAWQFREGTFERIASGDQLLRTIAVAPTLMD